MGTVMRVLKRLRLRMIGRLRRAEEWWQRWWVPDPAGIKAPERYAMMRSSDCRDGRRVQWIDVRRAGGRLEMRELRWLKERIWLCEDELEQGWRFDAVEERYEEWEREILREQAEELRHELGWVEPGVEAAVLRVQSLGILRRWQDVASVCLEAWGRWVQQERE